MKKCYLVIAFLFLLLNSYSQKLSQVTFLQAANFAWFSLVTNQNILIRISADGKILEYGTEQSSLYDRNLIAEKLLPYQGAITYYQNERDSVFNGKIKNIGTCYFTYYPSNSYPENVGKIKSAGNLLFYYYRQFEDALIGGRIKKIGSDAITYFNSYDDEALRGKLKSIGVTSIQYYSSFDDPDLKGKLKSIGAYRYEWMKTFSGKDFYVSLKSGLQRQVINGIIYIPNN